MEQRGITQVAHMDSSRRKVALALCGVCLEKPRKSTSNLTHGVSLVIITTLLIVRLRQRNAS